MFTKDEFDFTRFRGAAPFTLNLERLTEVYWQAGTALAKNIGEVRELILRELRAGRTIIGEFGQAYWLDKRHGYSPNVTASHTFTPEFFESAGIPVQRIHTFGVAKAYDTKVGTHTFLTQMDDAHPLAMKLKQIEFGTSTGRQRMVGWYDAVEKGDALRYGGFQDLMINKADALTHAATGAASCSSAPPTRTPPANATPTCRATRPCARRSARSTRSTPAGPRTSPASAASPTCRKRPARYVAAMMKSILDVAYAGEPWPTTDKLPNLRYLGVGPEPSQIIKDVPATGRLSPPRLFSAAAIYATKIPPESKPWRTKHILISKQSATAIESSAGVRMQRLKRLGSFVKSKGESWLS